MIDHLHVGIITCILLLLSILHNLWTSLEVHTIELEELSGFLIHKNNEVKKVYTWWDLVSGTDILRLFVYYGVFVTSNFLLYHKNYFVWSQTPINPLVFDVLSTNFTVNDHHFLSIKLDLHTPFFLKVVFLYKRIFVQMKRKVLSDKHRLVGLLQTRSSSFIRFRRCWWSTPVQRYLRLFFPWPQPRLPSPTSTEVPPFPTTVNCDCTWTSP